MRARPSRAIAPRESKGWTRRETPRVSDGRSWLALQVGEVGNEVGRPGDTAQPQPGRQESIAAVFGRSEEHTSELQSLMRISYAVFCLKKKTKQAYKRLHNTRQTTRQT